MSAPSILDRLINATPTDLAAFAVHVAELEADIATRRAYCAGCASMVRFVDEDRCCRDCGGDVAIMADQMSLELVRDHASALAARVAELEAENAALRAEAILRGGGEVPPGWGRFPGHTEAEPFFRQIIDADHWRYCLLVDVREGGSIDWEVSRSYCAHREIVDRGDEPSRSILKAMAAAEACFNAAGRATP